ncbi:hypothetical protein Tco_0756812 [Tanacetum coccineum]
MKVIMEGSEKLVLLKINDDSFACNTPLGTIFDEFNRLSGIYDDLFTYEVEIPRLSSVPSNKKEGDDSNDGDLDVYEPRVCYDENNGIYAEAVIFVNKRLVRLIDVTIEQWLNLMYGDHKKVDIKVKEGVISKWEPNDDHGFSNFDNDLVRDNAHYHKEEEQYKGNRCELLGNPHQELPVCKVRRFEMIKYSFGPEQEYVSIK